MSTRNTSSAQRVCVLALALSAGCSSTSTAGDAGAGSDSGAASTDAGGGGGDSGAGGDAAAAKQNLNGCTDATYLDRTGATADRTLVWKVPLPVGCIKIAKGQSVKWSGTLDAHPLLPKGGDTGSPIVPASSGTEVTITFPAEGVFGFVCDAHPEMTGAVWVTP